jgi:hypothetical protein
MSPVTKRQLKTSLVTQKSRHKTSEAIYNLIIISFNWRGVVAQEAWRGGSMAWRGDSMAWRGGSMVVRQTVVLQSRVRIRRLPSPQLNAHLLVGCRGLTSVRDNRGKNCEKWTICSPKKYKEKKIIIS